MEGTRVAPLGRYEWERILRRIVMPEKHKFVALLMATWADPDGTRVRPGLSLLACAVGGSERSERTVRRVLTSLVNEWGLLEQVSRGGGRGRKFKTAEYRLTIPLDLLDRHEVLDPSGRTDSPANDVATQSVDSPATQEATESDESPATQMASQTDTHPVDNPESVANQVADENEFQGTNGVVLNGLSGQKSALSGHAGWPTTTHVTNHKSDQHCGSDTDATTDRASPRQTLDDLLPLSKPPAPPPEPKCGHGLAAGTRPDGTPRCPLCRRETPSPEGGPPP